MPLYFLLCTLTEQGQHKMHDNPDLIIEGVKECEDEAAEILGQYAVLGRYDFVMMAEAEDNEAVARISVDLGVRIGLHIETLPAIAIGVLTEDDDDEPEAQTEGATVSPEEWRLPNP